MLPRDIPRCVVVHFPSSLLSDLVVDLKSVRLEVYDQRCLT
jgi:hypothetical protein